MPLTGTESFGWEGRGTESFVWGGGAHPEGHKAGAPAARVRADWIDVDGEPSIVRLEVEMVTGAPGVGLGGDLRDVVELALQRARRRIERARGHLRQQEAEVKRRADAVRSEYHDTGRSLPADFPRLVDVAVLYVRSLAEGQPPSQAVADAWNVKRNTAGGWVRRARELGLLDPATGPMARGITMTEES